MNIILEKEPFLKTEFCLKNAEINDNYNQYHQAGYDSFITGRCFINMIRYLCAQKFHTYANLLDNDITDQFKNKFAVYGNYFIKYLNLLGNEIQIKRNHVFHLKFPKTFQRNDINSKFVKYGGLAKISWIDDESAFVILKNEDQASAVVKELVLNQSNTFIVQCYSDYIKKISIKNGNNDNHHPKTVSIKLDDIMIEENTLENNNKKIKLDSIKINNGMDSTEKLFDDNMPWNNN